MLKKYLYKIYRNLPNHIRWSISYLLSDKFLIGVVAIVYVEDKILLLKHSYQKCYALPGGYLKIGEDINECVKRELYEELKISVEIEKILYIKNNALPIIDILFLCKCNNDVLIDQDNLEVISANFFSKSELPLDILQEHLNIIDTYCFK